MHLISDQVKGWGRDTVGKEFWGVSMGEPLVIPFTLGLKYTLKYVCGVGVGRLLP